MHPENVIPLREDLWPSQSAHIVLVNIIMFITKKRPPPTTALSTSTPYRALTLRIPSPTPCTSCCSIAYTAARTCTASSC